MRRTMMGLVEIGGLCLIGSAANAQTVAKDEPVMLGEIVVTATKRDESAQSIPLSITALTDEDLKNAGVSQTRDLVGLTPNLSEQGSYGRTDPAFFIRGIGNTQFSPNGTSKVGVYVDDTYLNSPAVHGAQLFDIQRIEVARGPQGTLFGQNSTGGLIRAITNKPVIGEGLNADAKVTVGRFNQVDPELAVGFDTSEMSAARISIFDQRRDGITTNTFLGQKEGRTDVLSWRAQWLWQPSGDLNVLANVHGTRDRSGLIPYKQLGLFSPAGGRCAAPGLGSTCVDPSGYSDSTNLYQGNWNVPDQHAWVDAFGSSVTVNWRLPIGTLTSVTGFERNTSRVMEDSDAGPADLLRGSFFGNPRQTTEELRLTSPEQELRWVAGVFYFHENLDSSVSFAAPGLGPDGFIPGGGALEGLGQVSTLTTNSYAGFGDLDYAASNRLKLSLGLRLTHETKDLGYGGFVDNVTNTNAGTFIAQNAIVNSAIAQTINFNANGHWNLVSGRGAVSYKLTDEMMGYASISRSFNSGNYNGGAFLNQGEAGLINPEELTSYEVGVKSEFGRQLRINAAAFYYDFKDQQVFVQSPAGFLQFANAGRSSLYGAEVEVAWKPMSALLLQLGSGYTNSRFDSFPNSVFGNLAGNALPSAPKFNVNALARYEMPLPGGTLALEVDNKYQSFQFFSVQNDPLLTQRAYSITDASISYATFANRMTVSVWGRNLADTRYLAGAYGLAQFGFDEYVPGEPRTYGLMVEYRFK